MKSKFYYGLAAFALYYYFSGSYSSADSFKSTWKNWFYKKGPDGKPPARDILGVHNTEGQRLDISFALTVLFALWYFRR